MNENVSIRAFNEAKDAAGFLADLWGKLSNDPGRGLFCVALSGGRTPSILYDTIADSPGTLRMGRTHIFLADERFVPVDHQDSNYRLIRDHLTDPLSFPETNINPVMGGSLEDAALRYERDLYAFFGSYPEVPRFDLIMLGIGRDGHTASLFPGEDGLREDTCLVLPVRSENVPHERITMTLPVINNSENVVFFVTGKEKAAVVKEIIERENIELPVSLVTPHDGSLLYVLDSAAAAMLDSEIIRKGGRWPPMNLPGTRFSVHSGS